MFDVSFRAIGDSLIKTGVQEPIIKKDLAPICKIEPFIIIGL